MSAAVYVYTIEDKDGHADESFVSDPSFACNPGLDKAHTYALEHSMKVIENTYEWSDSELVEDFTASESE